MTQNVSSSVPFQLSCDLNPRPVSSGDGFDYSKIRKRVKQNMELAKNIPEIKWTYNLYKHDEQK